MDGWIEWIRTENKGNYKRLIQGESKGPDTQNRQNNNGPGQESDKSETQGNVIAYNTIQSSIKN